MMCKNTTQKYRRLATRTPLKLSVNSDDAELFQYIMGCNNSEYLKIVKQISDTIRSA
jgi:hypothetical protein